MRDTILKQYKQDNYEKLSTDEKKNLIIQTIRTIQSEKDLEECDIEFQPGLGHLGFDFRTKKIIVDPEIDITSYDMLCALIHELRHQWQLKQEGKQPQAGQGRDYILSPAEKDAYEYSITEMLTYSDFFNDDAFDLNMINLINKYVSKRNNSKLAYEVCDYDAEEIVPKMISYTDLTSIYSVEEKSENDDIDKLIPFCFEKMVRGQNIEGMYSFNEKTNNLFFYIRNGMDISLINGELYIRTINLCDDIPLENVVKIITGVGFRCIKSFNEMGLNVEIPNIIHFPPALIGMNGMKQKNYSELLKHLNCDEEKKVSIEDIRNFDKNYIINGTVKLLDVTTGNKIDFGINYLDEYTPEQIEVLDRAIEWNLDLDDLKYEGESGKEVTGFYAGFQYKKDYSPQKLELILEAQEQGLNTLFYDKLNEEQIKHLMELQLAGAKRSEWIDLIQDKKIQWLSENSSSRPKQLPYSDDRIANGVIEFDLHKQELTEQTHNKDEV